MMLITDGTDWAKDWLLLLLLLLFAVIPLLLLFKPLLPLSLSPPVPPLSLLLFLSFLFWGTAVEFRASHILRKCSFTELHSSVHLYCVFCLYVLKWPSMVLNSVTWLKSYDFDPVPSDPASVCLFFSYWFMLISPDNGPIFHHTICQGQDTIENIEPFMWCL